MNFGLEFDSGKISMFTGVNVFSLAPKDEMWDLSIDFAGDETARSFYILRPGKEVSLSCNRKYVKIVKLWYYGDPKYLTIFYNLLAQFREETGCEFNFGIPEKLCPVVKPSDLGMIINEINKYTNVVAKMSPTEDNLNDVCNAMMDFAKQLKDVE